ncbi:unnamed protein product [Brassica rapa]|uniref:PUM-HD domain-containing protein n=1 Tax=Brassica campestris TaxID=3711 RepID=A0A3P6A3R8_BRACM|nr:unnamed protein product [Brassica rapa]VDC88086.1 unnamed protein product [Brassica rapa]
MENCQVAASLSQYLDGHYVQLSSEKFGSHFVQKCLETRKFNLRRIINGLISDIDSILFDRFGHYVIQIVWVDDMQSKLLYHINKNYPLMQCNMYGRKILEKLNAHPVVDSPSSPYHQLRHDTLRAYKTMYGSLDNHYSLGNTPSFLF